MTRPTARSVIYMLHFDQPYRHARHYVGWTEDLLDRLDRHAAGHGARLMAVIWQAGIGFTLVRICEGTRHTERAIKHAGRRGPVLPGLHRPSLDRPLVADHRRPDPPPLPQPCRKAVTPWPGTGAGRNQRNNPYQLDELFVKFHRTPAGIAWRWRTELLVLSGLAVAFWRLDTWTTATWAGVVLGGLAAVAFAVPHSRRFITRRFWCVLARHRLQRLCYEARLHTRSGGSRSSCGPGRPRSASAPGCCAGRASAPRTSTPTSASCAPPATPATPASPATAGGPTW